METSAAVPVDPLAVVNLTEIVLGSLTPEDIDGFIASYEQAQFACKEADLVLKVRKEMLVSLVMQLGHVPPHAEQSKRLLGKRNVATVTRGTLVAVSEDGVQEFKDYLLSMGLLSVFELFFGVQIKHTLLEGSRDVLKTLTLPRRTEEKIQSLFGRSIAISTKAPSLKVETIAAEKPARTPRKPAKSKESKHV